MPNRNYSALPSDSNGQIHKLNKLADTFGNASDDGYISSEQTIASHCSCSKPVYPDPVPLIQDK